MIFVPNFIFKNTSDLVLAEIKRNKETNGQYHLLLLYKLLPKDQIMCTTQLIVIHDFVKRKPNI